MIQNKEKKIYEQKYIINDLQKTKHVLNYRTSEMRKLIEPKEQQVEKLKGDLVHLENEYESTLKTCQGLTDKIQ